MRVRRRRFARGSVLAGWPAIMVYAPPARTRPDGRAIWSCVFRFLCFTFRAEPKKPQRFSAGRRLSSVFFPRNSYTGGRDVFPRTRFTFRFCFVLLLGFYFSKKKTTTISPRLRHTYNAHTHTMRRLRRDLYACNNSPLVLLLHTCRSLAQTVHTHIYIYVYIHTHTHTDSRRVGERVHTFSRSLYLYIFTRFPATCIIAGRGGDDRVMKRTEKKPVRRTRRHNG